MMKSLHKRLMVFWPERPKPTNKEAAETALLVFPRCC